MGLMMHDFGKDVEERGPGLTELLSCNLREHYHLKRQDTRYPGRNSNLVPPECESRALPLRKPARSMMTSG
jgi:hypothetical protein